MPYATRARPVSRAISRWPGVVDGMPTHGGTARDPAFALPLRHESPYVAQPMVVVRPPTLEEIPAVARLAGQLVVQHEGFDPKRFLHLDDPAAGYARFLPRTLSDPKTVLLAAFVDGEVMGYAYATLDGRDYFALLDACGKLHDIYVDERARSRGVGAALVREVKAELARRGAPRVVLLTATQNESAQRLFAKMGFRTTMLEMTAELDETSPK